MEGLRKALFTDIQYIKQEKKHHIGVILVSVSPIHVFWRVCGLNLLVNC